MLCVVRNENRIGNKKVTSKCDHWHQERISEFCIKGNGCGFSGMVANCDVFGGTMFALKTKARTKMNTYPNFVAVWSVT